LKKKERESEKKWDDAVANVDGDKKEKKEKEKKNL
jgi:hypothetical protein